MVEGEACFQLGKEKRVIGPADGEIVVEPGVAHGLASVGERDARLRCVAVPALRLQEFLEESAAAGRAGMFTPRGLPRGLEGARWGAKFLKKYQEETVFISPPPLRTASSDRVAGEGCSRSLVNLIAYRGAGVGRVRRDGGVGDCSQRQSIVVAAPAEAVHGER